MIKDIKIDDVFKIISVIEKINLDEFDYDNIVSIVYEQKVLSKKMLIILDYILSDIYSLEQMKIVLNRLKELGFSKFDFAKGEFNGQFEYSIDDNKLVYMDNLYKIDVRNDTLIYGSFKSNYRMDLAICNGEVSLDKSCLVLNHFAFNESRLPSNMSLDYFINKLQSLDVERKFHICFSQILKNDPSYYRSCGKH